MIDFTGISSYIRAARWVITAVVLAALLGAIGVQTVRLSRAETEVAHQQTLVAQEQKGRADDKRAHAEQREQDEHQARSAEQELYAALANNRKDANVKQAALTTRVTDLLGQLHDRPDRPADGGAVATAGTPAAGSTGAGLYRADGEFLVWFAADAAKRAIERDECRADYEAARQKLKQGQVK